MKMKNDKDIVLQNRKKLFSFIEAIPTNNYTNYIGDINILDKAICLIGDNKQKDYVAHEKDDMVSFAKDLKDLFNAKKRVSTTIGRYIRRNLKFDNKVLPDSVLDKFSKAFLSLTCCPPDKDFKILSGNEITEFYKNTTIKSCMTGDNAFRTELYSLNPTKINLVVYKDRARALLWHCDNKKSLLDRIYPSGSKDELVITKWAMNKGYTVSPYNKNAFGDYIDDLDEVFELKVKAKTYIPYMDSFGIKKTFKNKKQFILTTDSGDYCCEEGALTSWTKADDCIECRNRIPMSNLILINKEHEDYICKDCAKSYTYKCKHCKEQYINYDNYYYHDIDNNCYADNACEKCTKKLYKKCYDCNEYELRTKIKKKRDMYGTSYYCSECYEANK